MSKYLLRVTVISVASTALLYLLSVGTLRETAVSLAGSVIMQVVENESEGFYKVAFDKIEVQLLRKQIKFTNFRVTTDSASRARFEAGTDSRENMYETHIPVLTLRIRSLYNLYFDKDLQVSAIELQSPDIRWYKNAREKKEVTLSLETGEFYQLVTDYLNHFEISDFSITNGHFTYMRDVNDQHVSYRVGPVDASVENFEIGQDVDEKGDRFLNTEKLTVQIKNQRVELADSIHIVEFDDLTLSTETSDIVFTNLKLSPRAEKLPVPDSLNSYEVTVPRFRLTNVDFVKAYKENTLDIGEILFDEPSININEVANNARSRRRAAAGGESRSIVDLVTSLFDVIHVQNFDLQKALLDLKFYGGKNQDRFTVQNTNVRLIDFRIDTATVLFGRDKKLFEHIDFTIDEYAYFLPDSVHQLFVKRFHFSTLDSTISGDSLVIAPLAGISPRLFSERADVQKKFFVPSFKLTGVQLWRGWEEQDLAVSKLEVSHSSFLLRRLNDPDKKVGIADIANFYPYIDHIFKTIKVDSLVVQSSRVQFFDRDIERFSSPGIRVLASDFLVDSLGQYDTANFFHAGTLALRMVESRLLLPHNSHVLEVESFDFDPLAGNYQVQNLSISPYSPSGWSATGTIDEARLSHFFLKEFLEKGAWKADSIFLKAPDIDLTFFRKSSGKNRDAVESVEIGLLRVADGSLAMNLADTAAIDLRGYNFQMENIGYDPQQRKEWLIGGAEVQIAGATLQLLNKQKLSLQQLSLSLNGSTLRTGPLSIEQTTAAGVNHFRTQSVAIDGLDIRAAAKGDHLTWRRAAFGDADIAWKMTKATPKKPLQPEDVLNQLKGQLLGDFRHVKGGEIVLPARQIQLLAGTKRHTIEDVGLRIEDFFIDRSSSAATSPLGFAQSITLSTRQQNLSWLDGVDSLTFQSLTLSTGQGRLSATGVYTKMGTAQEIEAYSPQLAATGIDWKTLLLENDLKGDSLKASLAFVAVINHAKKEAKLNLRDIKWGGKPVRNVSFDYIGITAGDLLVENEVDGKSWQLPGVRLQLGDFHMSEGASMKENQLFFARKHRLVLSEIAYTLPDSLYTIKAERFTMSSEAPQLVFDGIEVVPRYGMYEHAEMLGYQSSWMRVTGDQIAITQPDMLRLLSGEAFTVGKVALDGFYMRIFRDKRIPFPEGQSKGLPHLELLSASLPVHVDSILLNNSKILYLDFAEEGTEPGELFMSNINAWVSNVTNQPKAITANPYTKLHAEALMLEEGLLKADFVFDLTNPSGAHYVTGTLGPLNMSKANSILVPSAFVEIRQGKLNEAYFNFEADTAVAVGTMDFLYNDLKIAVLSKKEEKKGTGKAFETFFANTFIVSANNPTLLNTREGGVFFERDTTRNIFNYWTKAFLSGIVSSIGAKSNKDKIKQWQQEVYERNAAVQQNEQDPK